MLARCTSLALLGLAALAPVAAKDCGNGNSCFVGQTCVSTEPGAGRQYGCAPVNDAVICNDARYSCPAGFTCNLENENCRLGGYGDAVPLLHNLNASGSHLLQSPPWEQFCDELTPDLPASCKCTEALRGGVVACSLGVLFSDHFGVKVNILPCDKAARVDLEVTESKHNINYTIAGVKAGQSQNWPIPGLIIGIPKIGSADVDASVEVDGSLSKLGLKVGLNACATVAGKKVCGSDLTGYLPVWVLHGSYQFNNFCNTSNTSSTSSNILVV